MPRRRTTRNKSKRPGPTIPSGDEGSSIDVECRKEKVKTLIQDFENEVQSKLRELDLMKTNVLSQIDLAYTVELMQIPPEIRSMKLTDFINNGCSFEIKKSPICSEVDSIVNSILNPSSDVGSSASTNQLQAIEEDENVPTTTTRKGRPRRKKADVIMGPPTVRRGRSRQQTGDMAAMQTPANTTRPVMSMMTPLITPKFDPRLYQTAVKRLPKPEEVLVSMDGSPIMNSNDTNNTFVLPVNKSQTIAFQDVSELSNLDFGTAKAALCSLEQMKEQLSAVINYKKTE